MFDIAQEFWLGSLLTDVVPGLGVGEQAMDTPDYYAHMGDCFASLIISELGIL